MSLFLTILLFVVILLVLVLVHELGHFLTAKFFGIRVDEFGVGFPPKAFGKKFGETEYTVNWLPLGGFVRIFGEDPSETPDETAEDQKRKFSKKPLLVQAAVIVAGVLMNLVLAWLLFSVVFMMGVPATAEGVPAGASFRDPQLTVVEILPDSPAADADLKAGDKITGIASGEASITDPDGDQFQSFIASHGGEAIDMTYTRGSESLSTEIIPTTGVAENEEQTPMIGVAFNMIGTASFPPVRALWQGAERTASFTKLTIVGLGTFFGQAAVGKANLDAVAGPVGIVSILGDFEALGFAYVLSFTAIISLSLAVINIIPFPALDGGRLLFIILEAIKGSPFKPQVVNAVNGIGFAILIILMIAITYHDIFRIVTG